MAKKQKIGTPSKPLFSFYIFVSPRTSPLCFEVSIHATREKMLTHRGDMQARCVAFFKPEEVTESKTFTSGREEHYANPLLGSLHFCLDYLAIGEITHEIFHAVSFWANREGCRPGTDVKRGHSHVRVSDNEELCAEAMGGLSAQMLINLAKLPEARKAFDAKQAHCYYP